jgi:hypothetical protein
MAESLYGSTMALDVLVSFVSDPIKLKLLLISKFVDSFLLFIDKGESKSEMLLFKSCLDDSFGPPLSLED